MNNIKFKEFYKLIEDNESFLLSPHINPDGDAVGSSLAFYHFLKEMGKNVHYYSKDNFPFNFLFLKGTEDVVHTLPEKEPDVYILFDIGSPKRVGDALYSIIEKSDKKKIIFDHHVVFDPLEGYDYLFIDQKASATAAIIYRFLMANNVKIA